MRAGHTYGTTLEQVIQDARLNNNRRIRWTQQALKRPVFSCISTQETYLIRDKPAPISQLGVSLKKAGLVAGILVSITIHDIRRGSARDMAYSGGSSKRTATEVARGLGHNPRTTAMGVTDDYIGPSKEDEWSRRIDTVDMEDPLLDRIEVAQTSLKSRAPIESNRIEFEASNIRTNRILANQDSIRTNRGGVRLDSIRFVKNARD
jgi:hypothetical protein